MQPFTYTRAMEIDKAIAAAAAPGAKYLAGGTNLVDLMKGGVETPQALVDIRRLGLDAVEELPDGGVRIGALAKNSDVADHPLIRRLYPLLARALLSGATPQLRNAATVGGNILQRTRCHYFYDTAFAACNKRDPGSGCAALEGENRMHAILGSSEHCVATHPSDMCVALSALDALVRVRGAAGERTISMLDFHRLPGDEPHVETRLIPGELIVAVDLPASAFVRHCAYLKVRDRASFAFALVSVAAAFRVHEGLIRDARIALGGVAHKPWRAFDAEQMLLDTPVDAAPLEQAAEAALAGARALAHNAFKIDLARRAVLRALRVARQ
ncbi:MAG TPA: xanthine dehydrogenase family protein subunit M [Burkholderiales bacterium]|nr:xanthine dehydrogenase family protein subunit M [Burkholderiales bacterium]